MSFDTFFAFLFTLLAPLFLSNLVHMLLRRLLDDRDGHGTAAIVQYGVIIARILEGARYLLVFDLRTFAASLGILGIVIAASSTQITQNILAGILITINRPIHLKEGIIRRGEADNKPLQSA